MIEENEEFIESIIISPLNSENKENILAYIGGFIIRKLSQGIDCAICFEAMISLKSVNHHR